MLVSFPYFLPLDFVKKIIFGPFSFAITRLGPKLHFSFIGLQYNEEERNFTKTHF
jgi:hypothetical protein